MDKRKNHANNLLISKITICFDIKKAPMIITIIGAFLINIKSNQGAGNDKLLYQ